MRRGWGFADKWFALLAFVAAVAACSAASQANDRIALWRVVGACVANHALTGAAFPCLEVVDDEGESGHVVLRPPFGDPDTVLVPSRRITGAEDAWLTTPEAPNYFAAAWEARRFVTGADERNAAVAVNSALQRSQDQLHFHIGCLDPDLARLIDLEGAKARPREWSRALARSFGADLWIYRTGVDALTDVNPFRLASDGPAASARDRLRTMIGIARPAIAGRREFVILASRSHGGSPSVTAEQVVDSACGGAP